MILEAFDGFDPVLSSSERDDLMFPMKKRPKLKQKGVPPDLNFVQTEDLVQELFNRVDRGLFVFEKEVRGKVGSPDLFHFTGKGTHSNLIGLCHMTLSAINNSHVMESFKHLFFEEGENNEDA